MEEKTIVKPEEIVEKQPRVGFFDKIKLHRWKILGGILGILVFAGAVFGAYKLGQKQVQLGPQPTPTPVAVATPTPEPTAGWKTYIDTAYNYSIKYPFDWYHRPTPTEGFGGVATFANYDPEEVTKEVGLPVPEDKIKVEIGVSIHGLKSGQTFKEWLDEKEREEGITQPETISYSKIIVGENIDATQKIATVFGDTRIQTIYFTRDSKVYFISGSSSSLTAFKDTFNLMLSTFKFLEEKEGLTNIVGKILDSPQNYLDKQVEIVGYYRGWDLLDEAGTGPPVTKSDWVIKDASGAIYVVMSLTPVPAIANLEPYSREDTDEIISLKGIVKINPEGIPYIQPI